MFCLCSIGDVKREGPACVIPAEPCVNAHVIALPSSQFCCTHSGTQTQHLPAFDVIRSGWFNLCSSLLTGVGGDSCAGGWALGEGVELRPKQSLNQGRLLFLKKNIVSILGSNLANVVFRIFPVCMVHDT